MDHGFSGQETSELVLGHGSAVAETNSFSAQAAYRGAAAAQRAIAVPPSSPLVSILERLEAADKRLVAANERLAGASGRLGTSNPAVATVGSDRSSNPGFIGSASDRIDDLMQTIESTAALAEAFGNAV